MNECKRFALGGGQCELEAGHDGKHQRGTFTWTDESQKRLAREWERRGGGLTVSDQDRTIPERPTARWWEYNPAQTVTEAVPDDDDEQRLGHRTW